MMDFKKKEKMTAKYNIIRHAFTGVLPAVALAASMLAGTACSIKEDRAECPSYLNVSFADRDMIRKPVGVMGFNDGELFRADVDVEQADPYWVRVVRKCVFGLGAYYGAENSTVSGKYISIPLGSECDSLYAFHAEVDCTGDEAFAEVKLRKQFCTVHLDIGKPLTGDNALSNYTFLVEGNTCGFDLLDFSPVPGSYRIEPSPEEGKRVVDFRVPRQADNSLSLSVWYHNDALPGGVMFMNTFPLGQYIERLGYSWETEELQDIYVFIDFVAGLVTVNVDGWEDGFTFTFIEQ